MLVPTIDLITVSDIWSTTIQDRLLYHIMLTVCYAECCYAEGHYAEGHYAECYYAECRYAECRYAECRSIDVN